MPPFQPLDLGIGIIVAGLAIVLLVWLLLRLVPRIRPAGLAFERGLSPIKIQSHQDALIIVSPGGRIEHMNDTAREWFELVRDEIPNLERLARRIRPSDDFMELCATQGQARFSISGRLTEGVSFLVPGPQPVILVSLRRAELPTNLIVQNDALSVSTLRIFTDFSLAIAASLNLDGTLRAIFENVERLVPADMMEVKIWRADAHSLDAYRFSGLPGMARTLEPIRDSQFGDYTAYLLSEQQPLFIPDTQAPVTPVRYSAEGIRLAPMRSYIGIPLIAAGELVGTLEMGMLAVQGFAREDLDMLQLVVGQAAVAIRNALLFEDQQQRTNELAGLSSLAQSVGSLRNTGDIFARLVQHLSALFDVEILGFLIYDETHRTLEGRVPYQGLPPNVVELYRTGVAPGSFAEQVILSQELVVSENASLDARWAELGLQDLAQAASLRDTVMAPLVSSSRFIGFLQLSNHRQGRGALTDDEQRLLNIVANQSAAIIDNALLVQETRQRAQSSEALRRITSLAGSAASLDEILQFSVREAAQMVNADAAGLFLFDDAQGVLRTHIPSLFNVPDEAVEPLSRLYVPSEQFQYTVTGSRRAFVSGQMQSDRRVLPLYRPIIRKLGMQSAINVPLVNRGRGIGELMLAARKQDFFTENDLQLLSTVAGQLALAIEQASTGNVSDETLRRRSEQLVAVSRIVRELNAANELKPLLQVVYDESLRTTRADCGMILYLERDAAAEGGMRIGLVVGHEAPDALSPLELDVLRRGELTVIDRFEADGFRPPHRGVQSVLVAPIAYQGETVGLIHLHAGRPGHFDQPTVEITETLAVQAAIAIGNAQRYREQLRRGELLRRRAETLSLLFQASQSLDVDQPLEQSLEAIGRAMREATSFDVVLFSVVDPESGLLRRVTGLGISEETLQMLKSRQQPWTSISQLLKDEFKIGQGYFIPDDRTPVVPADVHMVTLANLPVTDKAGAWHPDDILLFPLLDPHGTPLGLISLDSPRDGLRPDRAAIESLEVFAIQASLTLNSSRRVTGLHNQLGMLRTELERQKLTLIQGQSYLPALLHKDLEQIITINTLERRSRRIRASLLIIETLGRQVDFNSALLTLGRETLTQLDMSVSIVVEETADGPRLLHVLGSTPRGANPEALFGQRNPLRVVVQNGEPMLVSNLDEDENWNDSPLLNALRAKSFLCIPVVIKEKVVAAVLTVSTEPLPALTVEDRQVYFQLGRQSSIILENIRLLNETRQRLEEVNLLLDFSRQLSGLDPASIMQSLLESALRVISAAHAGIVFLWDANRELLLPQTAANYADNVSILDIPYHVGEGLPGRAFVQRSPLRVAEIKFAIDYNIPAEGLIKYKKATGSRLPVSSILIPIRTGEQVLGVLELDNFNTTAAFKTEDEALMLSLTQQVALALENVRLVQDTQQRASQLQALNTVAATITSSLKREDLVNSLLQQLVAVIPYDTATLWLRSGLKMVVAAARGFDDNEQRLGISIDVSDSALLGEMTRTGHEILVGDIRTDPRFPSLLENARLSWLGMPLIAKGETIGVVALEKTEPDFYSEDMVRLASTFAGQAAVALDNATLYEESLARASELDERSQRLALLNRLSADLSGSLNADQVLRLTAEQLLKALSSDRAMVVMINSANQAYLQSVLPEEISGSLLRSLPACALFERLRESLGVFVAEDVRADPELRPLQDLLDGVRSLMVLPLSSPPNVYAIFIQVLETHHFTPTEIELARTISNQSAIALQNAHLYESTLSTAERLAIINEASYRIGASLQAEDIYKSIHEAVARLMPVDAFVITLVDDERGDIDGAYIYDSGQRITGVRLAYGQGLAGKVIASGEPLMTIKSQEVESRGGVTIGERGTPNSIVAVPMLSGGRVVGSLSAQSYQFNAYTIEDQQILGTLANQATVAIQNARLFNQIQAFATTLEQRVIERTAELQREQRNTETLLRILTEVSSSLDLDRALSRTLSLLNEAIGAEQGTIMLLHPEDNLLHYRAGYGYVSEGFEQNPTGSRPITLKVGEGLAGWVVKHRQPALVGDLASDPRWVVTPNSSKHRSAIVAPLVVGEDVIGAIMVFHRQVAFFNDDALNMVQAIGSQVAISINNAQLYELIRDQAERLGVMLRSQQVQSSQSQAILESVADGVLVTDQANKITFLNASAKAILNLSEEHVIGQPLEGFAGLFGRTTQTWSATIRNWSEDPGAHKTGDTFTEQLVLDTGQVILVNLAPVIWRNEFLGTVSIFRDITREVEVDRLKSEFVATVSHELRTPMTSIRGYVDILLMGAAGTVTDGQRHFLDIVKSNTERLNILVNDLLDISRIEAGRVTLSIQPLDLRAISEDIISGITRRSEEENHPLSVTLHLPDRLPQVLGDAERVRQIIDNLVDNAYHYTPVNGAITITIQPDDTHVQVDVKDTGIGIPLQDQERVFERFFRGEDPLVLATPGTGLGLPIVKQLVEMHRGKIWMQSTGIPGQGCTFSFTLPILEE